MFYIVNKQVIFTLPYVWLLKVKTSKKASFLHGEWPGFSDTGIWKVSLYHWWDFLNAEKTCMFNFSLICSLQFEENSRGECQLAFLFRTDKQD